MILWVLVWIAFVIIAIVATVLYVKKHGLIEINVPIGRSIQAGSVLAMINVVFGNGFIEGLEALGQSIALIIAMLLFPFILCRSGKDIGT